MLASISDAILFRNVTSTTVVARSCYIQKIDIQIINITRKGIA